MATQVNCNEYVHILCDYFYEADDEDSKATLGIIMLSGLNQFTIIHQYTKLLWILALFLQKGTKDILHINYALCLKFRIPSHIFPSLHALLGPIVSTIFFYMLPSSTLCMWKGKHFALKVYKHFAPDCS